MILRSRTPAQHDSAWVALRTATQHLAIEHGCCYGVYEPANAGMRRHRWLAVEAAADQDSDLPAVLDEHTGCAFTRLGAQRAAMRALDPARAHEDAERAMQLDRLHLRARVRLRAFEWAARALRIVTAVALISIFTLAARRNMAQALVALTVSNLSLFIATDLYHRADNMRYAPKLRHLRKDAGGQR